MKNEASVSARRRLIGMVHGSLRDREGSRALSVRGDEPQRNGGQQARGPRDVVMGSLMLRRTGVKFFHPVTH